MLPFWATMSKQRSTLSKGRNFNAKLVRHCCRLLNEYEWMNEWELRALSSDHCDPQSAPSPLLASRAYRTSPTTTATTPPPPSPPPLPQSSISYIKGTTQNVTLPEKMPRTVVPLGSSHAPQVKIMTCTQSTLAGETCIGVAFQCVDYLRVV